MTYFSFDGTEGLIETYEGGAFIFWGGMGFHLCAISNEGLLNAVKQAIAKLKQ